MMVVVVVVFLVIVIVVAMVVVVVVVVVMMMMTLMSADTEPAWIDVLIDLLMSSLSQDQTLVRVVINSAFTQLIPQLTTTSLRLILDVSPHSDLAVNRTV